MLTTTYIAEMLIASKALHSEFGLDGIANSITALKKNNLVGITKDITANEKCIGEGKTLIAEEKLDTTELTSVTKQIAYLESKMDYLENHGGRKNIWVFGLSILVCTSGRYMTCYPKGWAFSLTNSSHWCKEPTLCRHQKMLIIKELSSSIFSKTKTKSLYKNYTRNQDIAHKKT